MADPVLESTASGAPERTWPFVRDLAYYEERAHGLVRVHAGALPNALDVIRAWHPRFAGATRDEVATAELGIHDARLVYARQHGFPSWDGFLEHVAALIAGTANEPFMDAFDAIRGGDEARLSRLLGAHPALLAARGTNGNTLLNLASSLARPSGAARGSASGQTDGHDPLHLVRLLLDRGADVGAPNDRGWTPLHQACYANQSELAVLLLDAGAATDREAHGSGGTPLAVALFWGHREAADIVAARSIEPGNLRIAAALGRADLVSACFGADGLLTPAACAGRGFYRPHSGFPDWRPSADDQEILDEALVWAAKSDRIEVLPLLVDRGARLSGDPYRGTPLLWAANTGRLAAATWLLDHGADPNQRATFGGLSHGRGVTALHLAAQGDRLPMAQLLVSRGADPAIEDGIYRSSAAGWARHFGANDVREFLERLPGASR